MGDMSHLTVDGGHEVGIRLEAHGCANEAPSRRKSDLACLARDLALTNKPSKRWYGLSVWRVYSTTSINWLLLLVTNGYILG
jgi:hypothetical protein